MVMYANKVNGGTVAPSESVTSQFEYILVSSTVSFLPNGVTSNGSVGTLTTQSCLDKLVEIISLRGQPVIYGSPAYDGTTYYTMRVAIEHFGGWSLATPTLLATIGLAGIDVGLTTGNTTVTISASL